MRTFNRQLWTVALALLLSVTTSVALADDDDRDDRRSPTILDTLLKIDGAQALVAAVLVVDDADVLGFSLADLLDNRREEIVLLAPSNAAFEKLLGLDEGFLVGLEIAEVQAALPGALPPGVGVGEVAAILLKHAAFPRRANFRTASENALLRRGHIAVAYGDILPVGIGGSGVQVNYETTIIKANIPTSNGIIHFIDTVIVDDLL